MSDYTVVFDGAGKDGLTTGNASKIAKGADLDVEFDAIAVAVATKYDSGNLASQAQAQAGTDNTVLMTPLRAEQHVQNWAGENDAIVEDLQALDLSADSILFWDESGAAAVALTLGTGLSFTATPTLDLAATLVDVAGLAVTNSGFIVGDGSNFVLESGATARTSLGVAIGSDVQAWDANLDQIAALAVTDSSIMVGNGSAWVNESGATMRTSLGLGTGNSPQFTAINLGHASDTTISQDATGKIAVANKSVLLHTSTSYNSAEITFSTSAASGGASGDIWFRYVA